MRERRVDDAHRSQVHRPDEDARQHRRREKDDREREPDAGVAPAHQALRLRAFATAWTKFTTRGPQRDATESSIPTTRWVRRAAMPLQPGRLAIVAADWPQQRVSASTIRPGFCARMYSPDSCG